MFKWHDLLLVIGATRSWPFRKVTPPPMPSELSTLDAVSWATMVGLAARANPALPLPRPRSRLELSEGQEEEDPRWLLSPLEPPWSELLPLFP
jgi:hypothetical protein